MKLIWLTDLHLVDPSNEWPQAVDPLERLRVCLDEIKSLHSDASRIIISGDLIQIRNFEAYHVLREELESQSTEYRLLVGNHDDRDAFANVFPEMPRYGGFIQGSEDLSDVRVLYLDTMASDHGHHGELCSTRIRWLEEQFEAAADRPLLIFLHHPPFQIGVPALDRLGLLEAAGFVRLLQTRFGRTHLFCGHLHRNVSGVWAGHQFACLKSTHVQFDLDMIGHKLVRSNERPGYGIILVQTDGLVVNYRDV